MVENSFAVTGMTCSACAAHVQKAVAKLDGVDHCEVNIATEKMTVRYDENKVDFETLKKNRGGRRIWARCAPRVQANGSKLRWTA